MWPGWVTWAVIVLICIAVWLAILAGWLLGEIANYLVG